MLMMKYFCALGSLLLCTSFVGADEIFTDGPVINGYGKAATVIPDEAVDPNQKFKVAFDVGEQTEKIALNRSFDGLARFINLHAKAGLEPVNIELALVVHGTAANDLLNDATFQSRYDCKNPNLELIKLLMNNRVKIYLCGQTAAYREIEKEHLPEGVQIALSAMTAHALLQQQGYTLNPF